MKKLLVSQRVYLLLVAFGVRNKHLIFGFVEHLIPWVSEPKFHYINHTLGAEKGFWRLPGVHSTAVGYIAGFEKYSFQGVSYEDVCSQKTGNHLFTYPS